MRKHTDSNYDLEELVLRVFLKHVKANNLYIAFRWSVNHNNAYRDIIHALSSHMLRDSYKNSIYRISKVGSSFQFSSSINEMLRDMRNCSSGGHKVNVVNDGKCQMIIMTMVNNLIHSCIEHAIVKDFERLEKLGSSVFEEVCKKLFGDSFKDMTEEAIDPKQREFFEKMSKMGGMPNPEHIDDRLMRMIHEEMRRRMRNRRDEDDEAERDWRIGHPYVPLHTDDDYDLELDLTF